MNFIFLLAFLVPKKELPYPDTRINLFYLVLFTRYNEKYGELLTYVWDICREIRGMSTTIDELLCMSLLADI